MKQKLLFLVLLCSAFLPFKTTAQPTTLWSDNANTTWYNAGSYTFTLTTPNQLAGLAILVEGGNNFAGKTIMIGSNLDLGAHLWKPIGKNTTLTFSGIVDGNNQIISNLYVSNLTTSFTGLFGQITNATVKNIVLQNPTINAKDDAGCIAGGLLTYSYVLNCHATGVNISGTGANIGGLVGSLLGNSTISKSSSSGQVNGLQQIGGIVGSPYDFADIVECYSEGTVTGGYHVGGIAGYSAFSFLQNRYITVNNCYSRANIIATNGPAGGIYGGSTALLVVKNSYATGLITCPGVIGGGLGEISSVNAVNNYWDMESTGTTIAIGTWTGPVTAYELTGKTTAEMKSATMVNLLNQNQSDLPWTINTELNDGYPILASSTLSSQDFLTSVTDIMVYPTLVNDIVTVVSSVNLIEAKLYSISGSLVKSQNLNGNENRLDLNEIGSGIYFLSIKSEQGISTHKIIKR